MLSLELKCSLLRQECTHRSLLVGLWLHRSLHQEQQLLKCNEKGRITQNTAEQSTVKESNAFKSLHFLSVSQHCILMYCMPHDSLRTKTLQYITSHFTLHSYYISHYYHGILQLVLYVYIYHHRLSLCSQSLSVLLSSVTAANPIAGWLEDVRLPHSRGPGPFTRAMLTRHTRKTSW